MKRIIFTILILFFLTKVIAQSYGHTDRSKLKEYRNYPHWINMMDDPNVNYYEAVLAFEEFWKGKPNPLELLEGEEGEEHEYEERSAVSRLFKSEKREKKELVKYALDYKRFKFWQVQHEGFVKPDGRIMTQEEMDELIQQELRNRQNSNK